MDQDGQMKLQSCTYHQHAAKRRYQGDAGTVER